MGRRDAVQVMLEVVAECRRLLPGLIVTWEPGWETRGNGTSANYSFGSVHHTASASSAARPFPTQRLLVGGRSDLPGPLANVGTPWCTVEMPRLHVVAAHPANHGGASRASGPVPKLSLFNPTSMGNEIDYAGTVPMSAGQLLVGHVWTRAVANVLAGGNVEHVRGHYETSVTGKWDPGYASGRSYDMADWRRKAAAVTPPTPARPAPQEDDMPLSDDDIDRIWRHPLPDDNGVPILRLMDIQRQLTEPIASRVPGADPNIRFHPRDLLALIDANVFSLVAAALNGKTADVDEQQLAAALAPLLMRSAQSLSQADLDAVAKAVADEQARRQTA